jgi:hypothetical protein
VLVEHWDSDDWSRLWWVRADLEHVAEPPQALLDELADRLARTVPQYAETPSHRALVCRIARHRLSHLRRVRPSADLRLQRGQGSQRRRRVRRQPLSLRRLQVLQVVDVVA